MTFPRVRETELLFEIVETTRESAYSRVVSEKTHLPQNRRPKVPLPYTSIFESRYETFRHYALVLLDDYLRRLPPQISLKLSRECHPRVQRIYVNLVVNSALPRSNFSILIISDISMLEVLLSTSSGAGQMIKFSCCKVGRYSINSLVVCNNPSHLD